MLEEGQKCGTCRPSQNIARVIAAEGAGDVTAVDDEALGSLLKVWLERGVVPDDRKLLFERHVLAKRGQDDPRCIELARILIKLRGFRRRRHVRRVDAAVRGHHTVLGGGSLQTEPSQWGHGGDSDQLREEQTPSSLSLQNGHEFPPIELRLSARAEPELTDNHTPRPARAQVHVPVSAPYLHTARRGNGRTDFTS